MFVVIVQCADDGSVLAETFGPFNSKKGAFAWAKQDAFVALKEFNEGEGLDDKEIRAMLYSNSAEGTVGYEGGMTWVIQKVVPVKASKRLGTENAKKLRIIFKDEGADNALSVAKKLGFTKVQALELFKGWV